jgi:hypothetical protein
MEEKEYICEKCNFKSKYKQGLEAHLKTEKHKTGKNKVRFDKKLKDKCPHCDYTSIYYQTMEQHILNKHASIKERREQFTYYCRQDQYEKHTSSSKHLRMMKKE